MIGPRLAQLNVRLNEVGSSITCSIHVPQMNRMSEERLRDNVDLHMPQAKLMN